MSDSLIVKKGDVIAQLDRNAYWNTIKILEVDEWPDGSHTAHYLSYKSTKTKPNLSSLKSLEIMAYHAPIRAESFQSGWEVLGSEAPKDEELTGFIEYLKHTDFERYARFTKQDVKQLISEANSNYKKAYALGDQGKPQEAIVYYSKAVDIFPMFYEAIDNRAFTYMDLGQYEKALGDFELSLQQNPNGLAAFFSKGECLLKLGRFSDAMEIFKNGMSKFPEKRALFEEFYNKSLKLKGG